MTTARPAVRQVGLWNAGDADPSVRRWMVLDYDLVVVNRRTNTIGGLSRVGDMAKSGRMVIAGVALQWGLARVTNPRVIRDGKWTVADPDWTEHSNLVQLDATETTHVKRTLQPGVQEFPWPEIEQAQAELARKRPGKAR
jgi:hypothetical protein